MRNINTLDTLTTEQEFESFTGEGRRLVLLRSNLEKFIEDHKKNTETHYRKVANSSMHESFPEIYPNPESEEVEYFVETIWSILKRLYEKLMNNEIEVDQNNLDNITTLIKKDPASENLSEEVSNILENGAERLANEFAGPIFNALSNYEVVNNVKPLGEFGDISLNELINKLSQFNLEFLVHHHHVAIAPLKLIPFALVYRLLFKQFLKHCDSKKEIKKINNTAERLYFMNRRRTTIALMAGFVIPFSSLLILNFGKMSILNAIEIKSNTLDKLEDKKSILLLPYGSSSLLFIKNPFNISQLNKQKNNFSTSTVRWASNKNKRLPENINRQPDFYKNKPEDRKFNFWYKFLKLIIFILLSFCLIKYSLLSTI